MGKIRTLIFVVTLISAPPFTSASANSACQNGASQELRFAAEPADDGEARTRFLQACRESEKDQNRDARCDGDQAHSSCYCQHFEARAQARTYLQNAQETCAATQAAAQSSACVGNANAETCLRTADSTNELAANGERRMASLAASANETASNLERKVQAKRRGTAADLQRMLPMPDSQLRGPVPPR